MTREIIFIVEGYHDVAIITKLLKINGYEEVRRINKLSQTFSKLLPNKFPFIENRLNIFNVIPMFMRKVDTHVVIINAVGETNLFSKLDMVFNRLEIDEISEISRIVIFADGDTKDREEKLNSILSIDFEDKGFEFIVKDDVSYPNPHINFFGKFKINLDYFIFPNNDSAGRLENVVIDAINESDGQLLDEVKAYVENIDEKYKTSWNVGNSKKEKALIGVAGNAIIPGSSNTTVLYSDDVDWISISTISKVDSLKKVNDYLLEVLSSEVKVGNDYNC